MRNPEVFSLFVVITVSKLYTLSKLRLFPLLLMTTRIFIKRIPIISRRGCYKTSKKSKNECSLNEPKIVLIFNDIHESWDLIRNCQISQNNEHLWHPWPESKCVYMSWAVSGTHTQKIRSIELFVLIYHWMESSYMSLLDIFWLVSVLGQFQFSFYCL